jgi:hypothetical protein
VTDDLSLDLETVDRQRLAVDAPSDPWLARRLLTIGASEVPALYLALGRPCGEETPPRYLKDLARALLAQKAGLRGPLRRGAAADKGNAVEELIVAAWNEDPLPGWPQVTHASVAPREWMPLVDRHCPGLSATPDAWCRVAGELCNVQVKSTVRPDAHLGPWWHRLQVQAEMAVTGSSVSILLYGRGWAGWSDSMRRAPEAVVVERDDDEIERIRDAVRIGWQRVAEMKHAVGVQKESA